MTCVIDPLLSVFVACVVIAPFFLGMRWVQGGSKFGLPLVAEGSLSIMQTQEYNGECVQNSSDAFQSLLV